MPMQYRHEMFPDFSHDETARQEFVLRLREYVAGDIAGGNATVWNAAVEPAFIREHGRKPKNRVEARHALERHPFHQAWSAINRTTQEMIWASVQDGLDRQTDTLNERARPKKGARGSLRLNPKLEAPRYLTAVDIHCMPGGYHTEYGSDDVYQGALYDRGAFMYGRGLRGPMHDGYAQEIKLYLEKACPPGFKPKKILDMGCAIGSSTGAIARMFPDAEIHGIDIGGGMLRYAHARAEAMNTPIHFSQQNAEATDFEDESFDLIFSCILMHETSTRALPNYIRESKRLLKPGGIALHLDFPHNEGKTPFAQAIGDWSTHYNAEPYIGTLGDTDVTKVALSAGFTSNTAAVVPMGQYIPGNYMHMLDLRKPA